MKNNAILMRLIDEVDTYFDSNGSGRSNETHVLIVGC